MGLSLRLILLSLGLTLMSLSPLSVLIEKPGGFVSDVVRHTSLSLAREIKREISFFLSLKTLNAQNEALSAELAQVKGELSRLAEVERENKSLLQQLGSDSTKEGKVILAQVSGFAPEQGSNSIIINRGKGDGVVAGNLVVLGNYLVGRVERVESHRSLVRLVSDPQFSVAALDQSSPDRPRGIVWGDLGSRLRMEKILPGEKISIGDLIISSGLDGKVPRGLILGEVIQVVSSEGGILKRAELKLLFDPSKLEEVFVKR